MELEQQQARALNRTRVWRRGRVAIWDQLEEILARGGERKEMLGALMKTIKQPTREALGPGALVAVEGYRCLRCGWVWIPRRVRPPYVARSCPACKSYRWYVPKVYTRLWKRRWAALQVVLRAREEKWRRELGEAEWQALLGGAIRNLRPAEPKGNWKVPKDARVERARAAGRVSASGRRRGADGRLLKREPPVGTE